MELSARTETDSVKDGGDSSESGAVPGSRAVAREREAVLPRRTPPTGRPWTPYLYLVPALAIYGLFVVFPVLNSFRLSLYRWPQPGAAPIFAGLRNFVELLRDGVFWRALLHNGFLVALSLLTQLPLAVFLAVLLSYPTKLRGLFRTTFFTPMIMPSVAIAVLWRFIFLPEQGVVDQIIRLVQPDFARGWLAEPSTALVCVFVAICWRYTGFHMVLFMAGISAIPNALYEAARLDGASEWQVCRHVTLPMLMPMLGISATLSVIGSLKYFDLVYMMAEGAPDASRELMATYIYRLGFEDAQGRFGYGSAAAVALFVVAFAVVFLLRRLNPDANPGR